MFLYIVTEENDLRLKKIEDSTHTHKAHVRHFTYCHHFDFGGIASFISLKLFVKMLMVILTRPKYYQFPDLPV
jgi:hypothetical protein